MDEANEQLAEGMERTATSRMEVAQFDATRLLQFCYKGIKPLVPDRPMRYTAIVKMRDTREILKEEFLT